MVLGVAEFFTIGLTAIPAVICGHIAKREMRQTGQRGDGLATGGLVLGYMAIIFWAVIIGPRGAVIRRRAHARSSSVGRRYRRVGRLDRRPAPERGHWHSWRPSHVYTQ